MTTLKSGKISGRLLLKLVPEGMEPKQYRFNHTDCPAGEDTRRRLYISVPDEQPWVRIAFCHNCQCIGYAKLRNDNWSRRQAIQNYATKDEWPTTLPYSARIAASSIERQKNPLIKLDTDKMQRGDWPIAAVAVLSPFGIDQDLITKHQIMYDGDYRRLIYTYFETTTSADSIVAEKKILSQQARAVWPGQKPKYVTLNNKEVKYKSGLLYPNDDVESQGLVFVEDLISAIKVTEAGYCAFPCQGVNISTEQLYEVLDYGLRGPVYVWFDNDNDTVKDKASDLHDLIIFLQEDAAVYTVARVKDPKRYSLDNISQILQPDAFEVKD